jgi:hypothetical protein
MDASTNALLPVAARVEAAIQKYVLVREVMDGDVWKKGFQKKYVSHNYTVSCCCYILPR